MATHAGGPGGKDSLRFECSAILIFAVTAICKDSAIRPGNNGYKTVIRDLPPPSGFWPRTHTGAAAMYFENAADFYPTIGGGLPLFYLCFIPVIALLGAAHQGGGSLGYE